MTLTSQNTSSPLLLSIYTSVWICLFGCLDQTHQNQNVQVIEAEMDQGQVFIRVNQSADSLFDATTHSSSLLDRGRDRSTHTHFNDSNINDQGLNMDFKGLGLLDLELGSLGDQGGSSMSPLEICNGLDDDGDSLIDNVPYVGERCVIEFGEECRSEGEWMCDLERKLLVCHTPLSNWCSCERLPFEAHTYFKCRRKYVFSEAQNVCDAHQADLVILNTPAENKMIKEIINEHSTWIGLSDIEEEGVFQWEDGSIAFHAEDLLSGESSVWTDFFRDEPNDHLEMEDCVRYDEIFNFKWNDVNCMRESKVICESRCYEGQDEDGDGALRCGSDCDDLDPQTYLNAPEICADMRDNDCDGVIDETCQ